MSLPDQSPRRIGSKWDVVMRQLKKTHRKILNKNNISLNNEIQVIQNVQKSSELKKLISHYINEQLTPILKKSSKLSEEIRSEGNKIYKNNDGNLFDSSFLYSLSMKCSETNSDDLAYAHGNRAAALMKIGFNQVARNDCEEALALNHPDKFKIYERLCSLSNASLTQMRKNVAGLEKNLKKSSKQSKEILQKYKTRLKAMEKETYVDNGEEEPLSLNKLSLDSDPEIKVKQMYGENVGRYVIAQKSIAKCEKIFSEAPFAFVPVHNYAVKKYFNTDCENCALVNVWPFLCLECRHSTYCSSQCRDIHKSIHKYECEGYKKNLFFEIGIAHLSLRVLLVGFSSLIPLFESLQKSEFKGKLEKIFKKILESGREVSSDYFKVKQEKDPFYEYARVLCLQPNLLRNNSYPQRNLPYAYTAQMLTYYLRENTTFFQDHMKESFRDLLVKSEWDILIAALLLRHIGQLVSNGHAIVDYRQNVFTTDALKLMLHKNQPNGGGLHLLFKSQRIFTGIFPRISMLNHSCDPNIMNCFNGMQLTIKASRDIAEGDEIFNCYGPHWKLMSYQERQRTLRLQYNFNCECLKCINRNDEFRFNNSVQCRFCCKRLFYPDKPAPKEDDDDFSDLDDDEDDESFILRCIDCKRVHENAAMKKFFSLLAQQSDANTPVTMNQLYTNYLSAVAGFGSLDEIRFHMTEMMLHTLITNRSKLILMIKTVFIKIL